MKRRAFLALVGLSPFGKAAAEAAAADLAGLDFGPRMGGSGGASPAPPMGMQTASDQVAETTPKAWQFRAAMANPALRAAIEDTLYEEERFVSYIDMDLATKRSFSLAAKVTFQRQRNVERRMTQYQNPWPYQRINTMVWGLLGRFSR